MPVSPKNNKPMTQNSRGDSSGMGPPISELSPEGQILVYQGKLRSKQKKIYAKQSEALIQQPLRSLRHDEVDSIQ